MQTTINISHDVLEVLEWYSLVTVMFHIICSRSKDNRNTVVNVQQRSLMLHTSMGHEKKTSGWGSPPEEGARRKYSNIQHATLGQPHHMYNIIMALEGACGDALLTGCCVPCVPSKKEGRKHSKGHWCCTHHAWSMWKKVGLTNWRQERENRDR